MSRLLINQRPLVVLPELAKAIGLNEAIVLQQIHYWIEHKREAGSDNHFIDGRWWTYNTVSEWAEQFPFWSESTVKRTLASLREKGLILAEQHGGDWDKTLWYSICYNRLGQFDPIDQVTPAIIDQVNLTQSTYSTKTNIPKSNTEREKPSPAPAHFAAFEAQFTASPEYRDAITAVCRNHRTQVNAAAIDLQRMGVKPADILGFAKYWRTTNPKFGQPWPSQLVELWDDYQNWTPERADRHKQATLDAFAEFLGAAHD